MKTREVIPLMVKLTPDEQRQRGVDLADARRAMDALLIEKKHLSKQIGEQQETIDTLTRTVHYCQEQRPVEVSYIPDLDADTMTTIRQDTLEIVGVRQLDGNERRELKEPKLKTTDGKTLDVESTPPPTNPDTQPANEAGLALVVEVGTEKDQQ